MKRMISLLCLLLCAAILSGVTAYAAAADLAPSAEIYAVMTLQSGREIVVEQAPTAAMMSAAESYELYVHKESVLSVESTASGGRAPVEAPVFYSADFFIPDTSAEVFLAGLTAGNIGEVQQKIIAQYTRDEKFSITDLSFIDAEKTYSYDDDDENLCWAASASNMLYYTGWAAQAGFDSEDDLLEDFVDHFDNNGAHAYNAMFWFFNSSSLGYNELAPGWAAFEPGSGGYLNDYAADMLCGRDPFNTQSIDESAEMLRSGRGVSIAVDLYKKGQYAGGHAVTLWGYAVDTSLPEDDPDRYLNIFLSDSDSYEGVIGDNEADRREADNVLNVYPMSVTDNSKFCFDFDSTYTGIISDYTYLTPYSADVPKETDLAATKDKANSPDLSILSFDFADADNTQADIYETGSSIQCGFSAINLSDADYDGPIYMDILLTDAEGGVYLDETDRLIFGEPMYAYYLCFSDYHTTDPLPAGDYTLTCTINPDHSAEGVSAEAYYYNNTGTASFKVRDTYLLGDCDDNGEVTILDATLIQRELADLNIPYDGVDVRGDINGRGLDIIDATLIQRELADFDVSYPIGTKKFYP